MTAEAGVLVALGTLLHLLDAHKPIECEDILSHQDGARPMIESRLGVIDRDRSHTTDAAVYECSCGWSRTVRLVPNVRI